MPLIGSGLIQSADTWPKASDWLIRDEFTDTVAAGSVNGTAATPGPGTRAATAANVAIGSGVLTLTGTGTSTDTVFAHSTSFSRVAGVAVIQKVSIPVNGNGMGGPMAAATLSYTSMANCGIQWVSNELHARYTSNANSPLILAATNATHLVSIVRTAGRIIIANVGGTWKLLWVDSVDSSATLYSGVTESLNGGTMTLDYSRTIALPAPFDTDTGLATDTHSGAVSAGTTFVHESDVWMEFVATTVPSGDSIDVQFRKADSLNYWICRINSSGDISLEEVVDGSETQRGLAAGVVSNGHRVVIIADDESIRVLSNNTSRISYGSAASAKTATAGEVDALGTGGAVSNVYTWPRTLGATAETTQAASIMDKVSA